MPAALASWRWASSLLGVAVISVVLWFFGPYLEPVQSVWVRLGLIAALVVAWAVGNLAVDFFRRRREKALAAGIVAPEPDPGARATAEESAAMGERMSEALALLKKARGTKGYLYEQPWYAIIGPPGAGKTTALVNAGLRFPLAAEMGQRAVPGVGGTRMCDWWFTEDAVLIDTAGRYTTRDSDAAVDRAGWEAFLNLLKRARERQPLNGVIVAIAVSDIVTAAREERMAHARAVRRRIRELEEKLAVRLPVYVLLTKADLIAGFSEFFDDLDRERRAQVWGATFALADSDAGPVGRLRQEFETLGERLNERLFDRLQAERSPERRALIAGFPSQFASLEEPIAEFMNEAFVGSRLDPAPMLRGFYLTSGVQEGTPIDRLTGFLARSFGIDQRRAPSLRPEQGRSYFLTRLMKEVIFGEAMLVSQRPGVAGRRLLLRGGAFAGITLIFAAGSLLLWRAHTAAEQQLADMQKALAAYDEVAANAGPFDPVGDGDLRRVLPLLDAARRLPYGYEQSEEKSGVWHGLFSQEEKLGTGAGTIYRDALQRVLLPRLLWQLESEMRANMSRPNFLYEATRVYLMLGRLGPLDPALVNAWMHLDWRNTYAGPTTTDINTRLSGHLTALLEEPLPAIPLDGALVARARAVISNVPAADRVYSQISPSAAAQALPPWRPGDAVGQAGASLFTRSSGKPLTEGIPGFYTVKGFYDVLLPSLPKAAEKIASESWVLGDSSVSPPIPNVGQLEHDVITRLANPQIPNVGQLEHVITRLANSQTPDLGQLEQDVIARYETEYAKRWDAMLADLELIAWRAPEEAVQNLYLLGGPQSPMRALLRSIARQLTLSKPEETAAQAQKQASGDKTDELKGIFKGPGGASAGAPGKEIDDRYRALRDYVDGGAGAAAPLDDTLKAMDGLRQELAQTGSSPGAPPAAAAGGDPVLLLRAQMGGAPQPVKRWLATVVGAGAKTKNISVIANLHDAFNGGGSGAGPLCKQALSGRYPFDHRATAEVGIEDFAKLFSPTGLISNFFNTELRPYVDTSTGVWRIRPVDGVTPPVSPASLSAFEQAAKIRDTFFAEGGATPALRFYVTPEALDSSAKQVTLQLGDTKIQYAHDTPTTTQIVWPGPSGTANAQVSFDPPPPTGSASLQASGSWALFRLLDQGDLRQEGPDRYLVIFSLGDRQASFVFRTSSVLNPFTPALLRGFQCPNL
jgi:type VI secretion system protein ImpL